MVRPHGSGSPLSRLDEWSARAGNSSSPSSLALKTITSAKGGDLKSIGILVYLMRTPGGADHLPSIIDIFVTNLRRSLIPSSTEIDNGDSAALDNVQRALHSLMGLLSLLNVEPDANTTPLETRKRHSHLLFAALPRMYLVGRFAPYCDLDAINIGSGIIEGLMALDVSTADAVRQSVGMLDLAIFLWMMKNRDVDLYVWKDKSLPTPHHPDEYLVISDVQNQRPCSVIRLVRLLFSDSVIAPNLWKRWASYMGNTQLHGFRSDPIVLFTRILVSRTSQIGELCEGRVGPTKAMFINLARLADIGEAFGTGDAEEEKAQGLSKAGYPGALTRASLVVSARSLDEHQSIPKDKNGTTSLPIPVLCIQLLDALPFHLHLSEMIKLAGNGSACLGHFEDEERHGYSTKIACAAREAVARAITNPKAARSAKQALGTLSISSRDALLEAISATYEATEGSLIPKNPDNWLEEMDLELAQCETAFRSSKKARSFGPCDNANHLKSCPNLPGEDWIHRHKRECGDLGHLGALLRQSDAIYLQHLHTWHVHIIQLRYKDQHGFQNHLKHPSTTYARLVAHQYPMALTFADLHNYALSATLIPTLDERFKVEYLKWGKERPTMENLVSHGPNAKGITRILEGIFQFGQFTATISLKVLAVHRGESFLAEDEVDITLLDHISRISKT
ncbi:hypothetical protein BKA70DRAFT_1440565 [Coprinopsis sp. MPI-PUGE-AT-0042]|nr:hypothetical protein BKA70DRAFT_1440565 [Coprinopsis sp. MPI-PUGE-AT-0042]